jgi:NADPH:quinone reductase-like Zn-dependent oxidoreductase
VFGLIRDGRSDPPVSLAEAPEPDPGHDETVVEVRASSINRGELALLAARPDGWRPGQDLAGVVTKAAASGEGPAVGTRVAGLVEGGAWAERVAVATDRLVELDDRVSFEDAATLGIAGRTALQTVRLAGPMLGRRVLILGAGGGVGHLTVQLAARAGARVTAHVHRPGRGSELIDAGAERVLAGDEPSPASFDVVLDGVGGASLNRAISAIRPGGTIVLFGATDAEPAQFTLLDFIGHEGASIQTYFSYSPEGRHTIAGDIGTLIGLVARGALRPTLGMAVDWRGIGGALLALRSGEVTGKVVLTFAADSRDAAERKLQSTGGAEQ